MNIEVHFGGQFMNVQGVKNYVGGNCKEIQDFETDRMSWFELRYMLKILGVISDYRVHCLRPKGSLDSGLEPVFSDQCVLRILNYLDIGQNVVLFIEHLVAGSDKEILPDYCLPEKDDPMNVVPITLVGDGQDTYARNVEQQKVKDWVDEYMSSSNTRYKKVCASKPPRKVTTTSATKAKQGENITTVRTPLKKKQSESEVRTPLKGNQSTGEVRKALKGNQSTGEVRRVRKSPSELIDTPTTPRKATSVYSKDTEASVRRSPRFVKKSTCGEHQGGITQSSNATRQSKQQKGKSQCETVTKETEESWKEFMQYVEEEFTEEGDHYQNDTQRTSEMADDRMEQDQSNMKDAEVEEVILPEVDSEYAPSDSLHSDSEVEGETNIPKYTQFNIDKDLEKSELEVGMQFESPHHFRTAIRQQAIKKGFDLYWHKNEGNRINVKCKAEGCPFRVYCSWNTEKTRYCVKTLHSEHTCGRALSNTQVTKRWLAKKYMEHFRSDPNMKWNVLKDLVQREVGVSITQHTCYRVRKLALEELQGKSHVQYEKLWDYAHALLKHNPGSHVKVKSKPISTDGAHVQFEAFFVSFAAMINGMLSGCRPVIGMDGCHLTSSSGGILLSAVSRDPNNQMYPVAYAVVEVENKETWSWFITTLLEALGVGNVQGWTFICDRQKGLVESLKLLVPRADVRFCVRHLYSNFKEKFKGMRLKRLLWRAAASYTVEGHVEAMNEIRDMRIDAFDYLNSIDKHLWARCYFSTNAKCDLLTNNICESFNKFILEAREKPILSMLELVRRLLMRMFEKKRKSIESAAPLGGKIIEKLKEMAKGARHCNPYQAAPDLFEVEEKNKQVIVNLKDHNCSCKQWMLSGIPCRHAICCIQYLRLNPEDFVHEYYSNERYVASYKDIIFPLPDQSCWEKQEFLKIVPPKVRKQPGRPKKVRKRAADEPKKVQHMSRAGQIIRCSKCNELGHNTRTCKSSEVRRRVSNNTVKRGRPRVNSKPYSSAAAIQSSAATVQTSQQGSTVSSLQHVG